MDAMAEVAATPPHAHAQIGMVIEEIAVVEVP